MRDMDDGTRWADEALPLAVGVAVAVREEGRSSTVEYVDGDCVRTVSVNTFDTTGEAAERAAPFSCLILLRTRSSFAPYPSLPLARTP